MAACKGSSQPRDQVSISYVSCIGSCAFYHHCCCCRCCRQVTSVVSDPVRPHGWQPTRLPRPWDSPGKNIGVGCHFFLQCRKVKSEREVAQSCPTLSDPMDCSPPGSSVHGIFQARVLEWGSTTRKALWVYPCCSKCHYFILLPYDPTILLLRMDPEKTLI